MAVATTLTNSMKIFHRRPQLLQYAKRNLSSTKRMDLYTEDYLKVNTYRSRREDWLRNLQSVQEVKDNLIETIANFLTLHHTLNLTKFKKRWINLIIT